MRQGRGGRPCREDEEGTFLQDQDRSVRSKSHDRGVAPESRRQYERQLSRQRRSRDREESRNRSFDRQHPSQSRAKELINGTRDTFDGLKREMVDKDRLIEQKNREIVKLRMENDEIKSNYEKVDSLGVTQQQRT